MRKPDRITTPKDARATANVLADDHGRVVMRWVDGAAQPTDEEQAVAWLAWAAKSHHAEGCACRGCIKAREMLRDRLTPSR